MSNILHGHPDHADCDREIDGISQQVEEAHAAEAKALLSLIGALDKAAAGEASHFNGLIKVAKQALLLDDMEASRLLKVSRPTVGRWIRGESVPHSLTRKAICDVLSKAAKVRLKQFEAGK